MRSLTKFLTVFFALGFTLSTSGDLLAQSNTGVRGTVISNSGETIPFPTVAAYDKAEENLLTGMQADSVGYFFLALEPGSYVLQVSSVSYTTFKEPVTVTSGEVLDFGKIILENSSEMLGEIEVEAERSQMELRFDKRVFSVGSDVTAIGGSALDVLDNVPSVTTDVEGVVSLRGNSGVQILINGKPSSTYSNEEGALRGLSSSMIEQVEVITNPSARYEAEGSAGIINIVLKKNEDRGFNGNVGAGTGYPEEYEVSANLNYRVENINWFLNSSMDYRSDEDNGSAYQRYNSPQEQFIYTEETVQDESEIDGNINFGADFYLPANQMLTASAGVDLESGEENTVVNYEDQTINEQLIREVRRNELQEQDESDFEVELAYENIFLGDDHKLTADFDFDYSNESENSNQNESILSNSAPALLQRTTNEEEEREFRFRADYTNTISDLVQLEFGVNSSFEFLDNTYLAEEQQNGEWVRLDAFADNFTYNEFVNAAYGIWSADFGKFSSQFGLRLEHSMIATELKSSGQENSQEYLNLFPSVFLNYQFNDQQSVQTSYSRRISRPWSRLLLPFPNFSNNRNRRFGNPNLNPEYSDSYELGFLQYWSSGSLLSSVYYRHETGRIERITTLNQNGVSETYPINLATEDSWGIEFSIDQDLFESVTINGNVNFFKANSDGSFNGEDLSRETTSFTSRAGLQWRFMDQFQFQSSMRYRGPQTTTQGERGGRTSFDMGFAMEMFNDKAVMSLNVRDLFNASNIDYTASGQYFYSEREYSWSQRSFSLNFTWYFNREPDRNRGGMGGGQGGGDFGDY
jgi:outer membrane receptor protein involved in Fe transport